LEGNNFLKRNKVILNKKNKKERVKKQNLEAYTMEKYLERNKDDDNKVLGISQFLEDPKNLVKVQSFDVLKKYFNDNFEIKEDEGQVEQKNEEKTEIFEDDPIYELKNLSIRDPETNEKKIQYMEELLGRADQIFESLDKHKKTYKMSNFLADLK
jgi:hypothetical protein